MNTVILMGFVGKDPETLTFDKSTIVKVSLATNEYYKNQEGEKKTITDWHSLVFSGKQVEVAEKYIRKGIQLMIQGRIRYRESEKDGVKRYYTDIHVNRMEFVGKSENNQQKDQRKPEQKDQGQGDNTPLPEDDLPF